MADRRNELANYVEEFSDCAEHYLSEKLNNYEIVFSIFSIDLNHQSSTELFNFCSSEYNFSIIREALEDFFDYLLNWKSEFYDARMIQNIVTDTIFALKNKKKREPEYFSLSQLKRIRYIMAVIAFGFYISKRTYRDEFRELASISELDGLSRNDMFYRGQQDCSWNLIPSVFREIDSNVVFDDLYYKSLTQEIGLADKFNNQMRHNKKNSGLFAYQKYAFFQHSCSYSPLLDLTSDPITSLSFALSNPHNKGKFMKTDSAVFLINPKNDMKIISNPKDASIFLKESMKLMIINDNGIKLGSRYTFKNSSEIIEINSFDSLYRVLTPDYRIIICATNDRMNYQAGAFICFTDCVVFNNKVYYEFNNELQIEKIVVKHAYKTTLLSEIYKNHREKDPEHLMNPYLYFNE